MSEEYDDIDNDIFSDLDKSHNFEEDDDPGRYKMDGTEADQGNEDETGINVVKKKKMHPPRKTSKTAGPQLKLDADRLCGPRGIVAVDANFQTVKLKGKGHEKSDLELVLNKMEHWAHRLFPKLSFDDCIERVEKLGNNRYVQVHMKRFRMGTLDSSTVPDNVEEESLSKDGDVDKTQKKEGNSFDDLVAQFSNPVPVRNQSFTEDQHARMAENKRAAEERRKSRNALANLSMSHIPSSVKDLSFPLPSNPNQQVLCADKNAPHSDENMQANDVDDTMDIDCILGNISQHQH